MLGDDLHKTDQIVESIVRKIERSAIELTMSAGGKEPPKDSLTVGGVPSSRYIQQFAWDYAKYPNRRPLQELVAMIGGSVTAIDEELKQLQQSYQDKQVLLQEGKRRKTTSLLVADLNDVLTAADMQHVEVHDTEYLKTLFIAVPANVEAEFKKEIYNVGTDMVGYGGPACSRDPKSLGQPVKARLVRDKRYVIRNFKYDPSQAQRTTMALEQLNVEVESMKNGLARWCKTHYGETFVAWMHIKVIRVFVESVLRYGLPVDFTAVLYKCPYGKEKDLVDALDASLGSSPTTTDDDEGDEYHDFVLLRFEP